MSEREAPLAPLVEGLVRGGEASAALAMVATPERVLSWSAAGVMGGQRAWPPDLDARFDLASLTKPFVATLALVLDAAGVLSLRKTIGSVWPEAAPALRRRQLGSLLRHRAGLAPWTPLRLRCRSRRDVERLLLQADDLHGARPGTYSDLGYILWGLAVEKRTGTRLNALLARLVARPLGLRGLAVRPGRQSDVVTCHLDNAVEVSLAAARGFTLPPDRRSRYGEVQDGNARFLGGFAGHAGLFGSARDLWRLGAAWLRARPPLDEEGVAAALRGRGGYALGWRRRRITGSAGEALPASAFGHTGFVGNSLWLDPDRRRIYLLLSHRRHARSDFNELRRAFHALAAGL